MPGFRAHQDYGDHGRDACVVGEGGACGLLYRSAKASQSSKQRGLTLAELAFLDAAGATWLDALNSNREACRKQTSKGGLMAIMIVHQGADWNQDLYDRTMERVIPDPSNPPEGLIATFGGPGQNGGWRVTDIWESEAHWERFRDETLIPVAQEIQAPPFDSDTGELHYKIVTARVSA